MKLFAEKKTVLFLLRVIIVTTITGSSVCLGSLVSWECAMVSVPVGLILSILQYRYCVSFFDLNKPDYTMAEMKADKGKDA